jgi:diguanylate cyclase (GGDEF)-like protein
VDSPVPAHLINILILAGVTLGISGLSFLAGMLFEKWYLASELKRASKKLSKMVDLVAGRTDAAKIACQQLSKFDAKGFTTCQIERLTKTQRELASVFEALLSRENIESSRVLPAIKAPIEPLSWQLMPSDPRSGLPDFSCCEVNLEQVLAHVNRGMSASLLLVQVDKFDQLMKRHGSEEASNLLKNFGRLLIGAAREQDVVCQCSDDLLMVLMVHSDAQTSRETADAIRHAVRKQRFRLQDSQLEILMTASFGAAVLKSGDDAKLAIDRAHAALSESRRHGRNQLHLHDGSRALLCHAG